MALSNPEMNEVETMKETSQDEEPIPKEPELGTFKAIHMIIAPMEIPAGIFDEAQTGITWVPMLNVRNRPAGSGAAEVHYNHGNTKCV